MTVVGSDIVRDVWEAAVLAVVVLVMIIFTVRMKVFLDASLVCWDDVLGAFSLQVSQFLRNRHTGRHDLVLWVDSHRRS